MFQKCLLIRFRCTILPGDPGQAVSVNGFFQDAQEGERWHRLRRQQLSRIVLTELGTEGFHIRHRQLGFHQGCCRSFSTGVSSWLNAPADAFLQDPADWRWLRWKSRKGFTSWDQAEVLNKLLHFGLIVHAMCQEGDCRVTWCHNMLDLYGRHVAFDHESTERSRVIQRWTL